MPCAVIDCPNCNLDLKAHYEPMKTSHLTCECGKEMLLTIVLPIPSSDDYKNEEWLRKHYVEDGMSMSAIAALVGVSPMTIFNSLKKHGIETRPRGRRGV
jgi:transcriptional regulator of acetoin/glycerol metabolism